MLTQESLLLCTTVLGGCGLWYLFNANFNNISVISLQSVLLVEKTWENHRPVASHWQTVPHNVVSSISRHERVRTHNLVVICTDCSGSWKFNYHTITTTTTPDLSFLKLLSQTTIFSRWLQLILHATIAIRWLHSNDCSCGRRSRWGVDN